MLPAFALRQTRGQWTPVLTFATPGNLVVVYQEQAGFWQKTGSLVEVSFHILTSTFTHTTAAGNLEITGVPFAPSSQTLYTAVGACRWQGITKANYTQVVVRITNQQIFFFDASGSGQASVQVAFGDTPTGGTMLLRGSICYRTGD